MGLSVLAQPDGARFSRRSITDAVWLTLATFAVGLLVFTAASARLSFHGDEGDYIGNARYFRLFLLDRDLASPWWEDSYWTHTQPMLTRYLVGGWLWVRGRDLETLPAPYDHSRTPAQNLHEGRIPSPELLLDARVPMVTLAAATAALASLLGLVFAGRMGGVAAGVLVVMSPVLQQQLPRATPEAPLACFLLLALLLVVVGSRHQRGGALSLRWAAAGGVALGLALASKLTALLGLATLILWGVAAVIAAVLRTRSTGAVAARVAWGHAYRWSAAVGVAVVVFIASNPHLYRDPLLHSWHLVEQRTAEMAQQRTWFPSSAVPDAATGLAYAAVGTLVDGAALGAGLTDGFPATGRGPLLAAGCVLLGAIALAQRTWRAWRSQQAAAPEGLILAAAIVTLLGVGGTTPMYWGRYLVPGIVLNSVIGGIGLSVALHWATGWLQHAFRSRSRQRMQITK